MKSHWILSLIVPAVLVGNAGARPPGSDIITGDVTGVSRYGIITEGGVQYTGYAFGTTSCNIGTPGSAPEPWVASTNQHPVIGQNLYRLKNNRFEQIGASWVKHAWAAVNNGICGTCNGQLGSVLGVGCSDPYGSGLNGDQSDLGPRSEINAYTGQFPYPYVRNWNQTGTAIFKRVRVRNSDLDPAQNAGALYFAEGHYVSNNEATLGNGFNNASYRRILVNTPISTTGWPLAFSLTTQRQKPAIQAWKDTDPSVTLQQVFIPNEGLLYVAAKVINNGNGTWRYEYALYNHNSHRSIGSFGVPAASGVDVSNIGFGCLPFHSSEPMSADAWPGSHSGGVVNWATTPYDAGFAAPGNIPALQGGYGNAIRWSGLYNFWFDADQPPVDGTVTLGLWRPGTPTSVTAVMPVPAAPPPPACAGDANGDLVIDAADLSVLLSNFGQSGKGPGFGDFNGDGQCDGADLSVLLGAFGSTCN